MAKEIVTKKSKLGYVQMGCEVMMSVGRVDPGDKVIAMNIDFNKGDVLMRVERDAPVRTKKKAAKKKTAKKKTSKRRAVK